MSYQTEEILGNIAVIAFGSAIGAVILEVIYFFGFFIFHDCGKWICSHEPDISWTSYGIFWFFRFSRWYGSKIAWHDIIGKKLNPLYI